MKHWKVGELARSTGLSVRTLHHYDEIGLLSPSHRTASGHRLYADADIARLQQIVSLRALGLPLDDVRAALDRRGLSLAEVIGMHAARLREQMEMQRRLLERLEAVTAALRRAEEVSADELVRMMEMMTMFEKYYTPEQMDRIRARAGEVGEARIREVEAEWPRLMAEVQAEMDAGTDPADPRAQALARRWRALVDEFTGGDPGIAASLRSLWQNEQHVAGIDTGPARRIRDYIDRAVAAAEPAG